MMEPRLPGVWYASNRQTAFYQVPDGADRKALFRLIFPETDTPRATDGGVVENACSLTTPDDERFQAITWWGKQLGAWQQDFEETAQSHGIVTARFFQRRFILSNGKRFWFRDLLVSQD